MESDVVRAYCQEILSTVKEVINLNPLLIGRLTFFSERTIDVNNPFKLADFAASISAGNPEKLQAVLAEPSAEGRLRLALDIVSKVCVYSTIGLSNSFYLSLPGTCGHYRIILLWLVMWFRRSCRVRYVHSSPGRRGNLRSHR